MCRQGNTGKLMQILASQPTDYSYFNKIIMRTWAGPTHWKTAPMSRGQCVCVCGGGGGGVWVITGGVVCTVHAEVNIPIVDNLEPSRVPALTPKAGQ